jgi:hypothetical protein
MSSVPGWLDLAKWTCFGLYFLLEDLTIVSECIPQKRTAFLVVCPKAKMMQLHAMDVYLVPWEQRVMKEANTFWFYALSFSLAGAIYGLFFSTSVETAFKAKDQKSKKNGTKAEKEKVEAVTNEKPEAPKTTALVRQIVVDGCDLFLPAALLGWMHTGDLVLGLTMVLSTALTGREIWKRV